MVLLQESKPLVTRSSAWQTWHDQIHIKPGQEKRPLRLTFVNGADGRPKWTDMHVHLAQKPFATMKDFGSSATLSRDMTGSIRAGNTPLTIQGFGPSGARLTWKLYTQKVTITDVKPNPFALTDTVIVQGKNFSENAKDIRVLIANKPVTVRSASINEVQLTPPSDLSSGDQDLVLIANSVKSNALKVTAKAHPKITWVNFVATAPGQPLVISGNGFSKTASKNIVKFGSIQARIISATETSITCIVPEMRFPQWYVPITVTTNGMRSKERVTINIDQRVIPNEGIPQL
jgi:hypothetical protein